MIRERALVVASENGKITVEAATKSTCSACQAQENCGTGTVARAITPKSHQLTFDSLIPVAVGDTVEIGIPEKGMVQAALWLYGMPLMSFFIAFAIFSSLLAHTMLGHELVIFGMALVSCVAVYRIGAARIKRLERGVMQAVILRKVNT